MIQAKLSNHDSETDIEKGHSVHASKSLPFIEKPSSETNVVEAKRSIGMLQTWSAIRLSAENTKQMWAKLSSSVLENDRSSNSSSGESVSLMSFDSMDW